MFIQKYSLNLDAADAAICVITRWERILDRQIDNAAFQLKFRDGEQLGRAARGAACTQDSTMYSEEKRQDSRLRTAHEEFQRHLRDILAGERPEWIFYESEVTSAGIKLQFLTEIEPDFCAYELCFLKFEEREIELKITELKHAPVFRPEYIITGSAARVSVIEHYEHIVREQHKAPTERKTEVWMYQGF